MAKKTSTAKREQTAAALAEDLGRRLGASLALRQQPDSPGGYRIESVEMTLAEAEIFLDWMDYYVETDDEQRRRNHGPAAEIAAGARG